MPSPACQRGTAVLAQPAAARVRVVPACPEVMPLMWTRRSPSGRVPGVAGPGRHAVGARSGHDGVAGEVHERGAAGRVGGGRARARRGGPGSTSAVRTPASRRVRPRQARRERQVACTVIRPAGVPQHAAGGAARAAVVSGRGRAGTGPRLASRRRARSSPSRSRRRPRRSGTPAGSETRVTQAPGTSSSSPARRAARASAATCRSSAPSTPSTRSGSRRVAPRPRADASRGRRRLRSGRPRRQRSPRRVVRRSCASGSGRRALVSRRTPSMGRTARPSMATQSRTRMRRLPFQSRTRGRREVTSRGVRIVPAVAGPAIQGAHDDHSGMARNAHDGTGPLAHDRCAGTRACHGRQEQGPASGRRRGLSPGGPPP